MPINERKDVGSSKDNPAVTWCRLTLIVSCLSLAELFCVPISIGADQPKPRTYRGLYRNQTYAYSVLLPGSVVAIGTAPPNPDHGFMIRLQPASDSSIS